MKRLRLSRVLTALALLALASGLSGCASTTLKGTPFYTGEYEKRVGPAEDRVNLWPLLYYRNPALSVLWPIFEHADDHAAVRPLYSVYRLQEARKEYNVLWPLAQFDRFHENNRVFPVYWGNDYAVVFPLYWHYDDPFAEHGRGLNTLFPLWIYANSGDDDYSLHLLWPLFNSKHDSNTQGWRLWPLYADWKTGGDSYNGWYAWPLGHYWGRGDYHSRLLLPLFYQASEPASSTFISLLGGRHNAPDQTWSYLFPLYFYGREPDRSTRFYTLLGGRRSRANGDSAWYALPALAWGSQTSATRDTWIGGPLYHSSSRPDSASSHLFPFYYSSRDATSSLFLSLPWSRRSDSAGDTWSLALPFWFHHEDAEGDFSVTPAYLWGHDVRSGQSWSAIPPVYYHRDDERGDTFLSPLFSSWRSAAGARNTLIPPALTYLRRDDDRSDLWAAAGLGHWSWGEHPGSSHLLPVYYRDAAAGTTLSPLYCAWSNSTRRTETTLVPPLLSWLEKEPGNRTLYALLGVGKFNWGPEAEESHLFPFYYRDPVSQSFLSLPYATWQDGDRTATGVPLLLSWFSRNRTERDLRLLLGLFGQSWSTAPKSSSSGWLFPLYAYGDDYWLTLLAGHSQDSSTTWTYFPTPLAGWISGDTHGSWLLPLYWYRHYEATGQRDLWYLPWGYYHADARRSESGLFPLYGYENNGPPVDSDDPAELGKVRGRAWHLLYLAGYSNRRAPIWSYTAASRSNTCQGVTWTAKNRFFPLWRYERNLRTDTDQLEKEFTLLFFLQDYWRKADLGPEPKTDYARTRILWRFLHYERDHDTVSLDLFPAITYDRDGAAKRKVSFLWRGFRYERKDGQKSVDLLFLPVWRTRWAD